MTNSTPVKPAFPPIWCQYPAGDWRDGSAAGNGQLGILHYGGLQDDRVLINHDALWYGSETPDLPDISGLLPRLRELLAEGRYEEASEFYDNELSARGYNPAVGTYHPAFDLIVRMDTGGRPFGGYRRWMDLDAAEVGMEAWIEDERTVRKIFASRADGLIHLIIEGNGVLSDYRFALEAHDLSDAITKEGKRFTPEIEFQSTVAVDTLSLSGRYPDGRGYHGAARIFARGGALRREEQAIRVRGAVRIQIAVAVGDVTESAASVAQRLPEQVPDYATCLEAHVRLHRSIFRRSSVQFGDGTYPADCLEQQLLRSYNGDISPAQTQLLYDYGRYLLVCSASATSLPCSLQGVWNGDYAPPWNAMYVMDENVQIEYWQALAGNIPEIFPGLIDFIIRPMEDYRKNARHLYGCEGIYVPTCIAPDSGLIKHKAAHVIYWTGAAGWMCQLFHDYWRYYGDDERLRDKILPFMEEAARFFEKFIQIDADGKARFSPSSSPENAPPQFNPQRQMGAKVRIALDSTIDVAVCRELFSNILSAYRHLGIPTEKGRAIEQLLKTLPDYEINPDGALSEWLHPDFPDNYNHRHLSHLYPAFPGIEISQRRDPALAEACHRAICKRYEVGLPQQTGWSLVHLANAFARLGDADRAWACLRETVRSCLGPNLFGYHNDYRRQGICLDLIWGKRPPLNLDTNFGFSAAILEMLLHSEPGFVHLLPALPRHLPRGRATALATRAGCQIDLQWDIPKKRLEATLRFIRDAEVQVMLPASLLHDGAENLITLSAKAGESIVFDAALLREITTSAIR